MPVVSRGSSVVGTEERDRVRAISFWSALSEAKSLLFSSLTFLRKEPSSAMRVSSLGTLVQRESAGWDLKLDAGTFP